MQRSTRSGLRWMTLPERPHARRCGEWNGNRSGRGLVGRHWRADWFGARLQASCRRRAMRCSEPKPDRNGGVRSADKQSQMGECPRKCSSEGRGDWFAPGLGCECLTNRGFGQGATNGTYWQAGAPTTGGDPRWNRCCSRSLMELDWAWRRDTKACTGAAIRSWKNGGVTGAARSRVSLHASSHIGTSGDGREITGFAV